MWVSKEERLLYLKDDMNLIGSLFDLVYINNLDISLFIETFMCSATREAIDNCHPGFLNMGAADLLSHFGYPVTTPHPSYNQDLSFYWVGSVYPYISIHRDIPSRELIKILPFRTLINMYPLGHTLSYGSFLDHLIL